MRLTLNLSEHLSSQGMSQQALAEQLGIDPVTAQGLFAGQSTQMDLPTLSRISQALGVLPHDIVASVEEKQPSVSDAPSPRSIDVPETGLEKGATSEPTGGEQSVV